MSHEALVNLGLLYDDLKDAEEVCMAQNHWRCVLADETHRLYGRRLHVRVGIVEQGHQLDE